MRFFHVNRTMQNSLFTPAPRRNGRLVLTLTGSLLFHGSLIGVAAFWPVHPVPAPPPVISVIGDQDGDLPKEPLAPVDPLPPESDPVQPELKVADPADAPPVVEPDADNMTVSTPVPPSKPHTATRTVPTSVTPRTAQVSGNLSGVGSPSGATGSGATSGVRWNKPKPVYPAALRLARVQGSGVVRVTTDGSGRVVNAIIVQSTGNAVLDDNTCRSARNFWSGPPNSTLSVPITYQLQ